MSNSVIITAECGHWKISQSNGGFARTETKAVTVYPVRELIAILPKTLHAAIRASRYHITSNDSLTFHAQSHRSRTANLEENSRKLMEEITRIYHANTPSETSHEKKEKHKEMYVNCCSRVGIKACTDTHTPALPSFTSPGCGQRRHTAQRSSRARVLLTKASLICSLASQFHCYTGVFTMTLLALKM